MKPTISTCLYRAAAYCALLLSAAIVHPASAAQIFADNALWFRADAGVFEDLAGTDPAESGDGVAFWDDQSVAGLNVTQSTVGQRPTYLTGQLNGLPSVTFANASTQWLNNTAANPMVN